MSDSATPAQSDGMSSQVLEVVLNISRQMAEKRRLEPLLQYAMEEAARLVGAERGYLVLVHNNNLDDLDFRASTGHNKDTERETDQISKTVLASVMQSGNPLVLRDAGLDPDFNAKRSVYLNKMRSVMCVPLLSRGRTLGAIYVENRNMQGRFSEKNLPPLLLFANQAAVAIENAALNDELEARVAARTQELENAQEQLRASWMQAVEINRVNTAWLANVAHDLRAPLTITISALSMMKDGAFGEIPEEMHEWVERSVDATNRALSLTNDVFDISKMEMGGLKLLPEMVDVTAFMQGVYDVGKGLPWSDTVSFKLALPDAPYHLMMDARRIQQVLLNLLTNALKFTDSGSVLLYAVPMFEHNAMCFGVRDTGEGIAPENLYKVFERFSQVSANPEKIKLSTGLGLAISRELVEMHKGHIWVESQVRVGSDFKFVLPLSVEGIRTPNEDERAQQQ
jgi:signal transduction histidine kinase